MRTGYVLGSRVQAQVTAAGLLLLALRKPPWLEQWLSSHDLHAYTSCTIASKDRLRVELSRVRWHGRAILDQQIELNYRCIAVLLRDRHGELVGALSVTMHMDHESSEDALTRVLSALSETAQAMRQLI